VPFLLFGALPWSVVVLASHFDRRDKTNVFLFLWVLIPFIFFSLSQSKRPQYILPLMPAMALLAARVWCESRRGRRWAGAVMMLFGAVLVAAPWFIRIRAEYGPAAKTSAIILGVLALAGGALAMIPPRFVALAGLTLPVMAIPIAANPVINAIAVRRSAAGFVQQLQLGSETEVVGVEAYTGSMSFYLRRPVVVVTPDGEELTSNYIIRHYDRFAGSPTLKPPSWLASALDGDKVFIVRADDQAHRAQLERRGLRVVATSARYVGYHF
jgi:4-amino-4-deoxy-L-arabinose transferase-like glycosyltransferase